MTVDEFNKKYKRGEPFYYFERGRSFGVVKIKGEAFYNDDDEAVVKTNSHVFPVSIKNLTKEKPKGIM